MGQPLRQDVHIDKPMSQILVAYLQEDMDYVADKVFPVITVSKKSDAYFIFDKGDFFRDEAAQRRPGSESAGSGYEVDTDTYTCKRYGFHKDINGSIIDESDDPLKPREDATRFVGEKLKIKREVVFLNNFFGVDIWANDRVGITPVSATAGTSVGFWNDESSTPIKDIKEGILTMKENTGKKPNVLVLGARVFNALTEHADILARIQYTQKAVITEDILAGLFGIEKLVVANSIKNSGNKGGADSFGFMAGKSALLAYAEPNPGLYAVSAGYIFANKNFKGASALGSRIYTIETPLLGLGSYRLEGEMEFDMKVVATDLGYFFSEVIE